MRRVCFGGLADLVADKAFESGSKEV